MHDPAARSEKILAEQAPLGRAMLHSTRRKVLGGSMLRYLSCEFVLKKMPNGGTAVLLRAALISLLIYLATIGFKSRVTPDATWNFDSDALRAVIADTIPWFGAIFAGVYVALYSRFASQWSYLASLYNQIMQTAVEHPPEGITSEAVLRVWQAAFIEDAEDLHLATKPMFASIIRSMLGRPEIRNNFVSHSPGGAERLANLELKIAKALEASIRSQGLAVNAQTMPDSASTSANNTRG